MRDLCDTSVGHCETNKLLRRPVMTVIVIHMLSSFELQIDLSATNSYEKCRPTISYYILLTISLSASLDIFASFLDTTIQGNRNNNNSISGD